MSAWIPTTFVRKFRGWNVMVFATPVIGDVLSWSFSCRKKGKFPHSTPYRKSFKSAKRARIAAIKFIKTNPRTMP